MSNIIVVFEMVEMILDVASVIELIADVAFVNVVFSVFVGTLTTWDAMKVAIPMKIAISKNRGI